MRDQARTAHNHHWRGGKPVANSVAMGAKTLEEGVGG